MKNFDSPIPPLLLLLYAFVFHFFWTLSRTRFLTRLGQRSIFYGMKSTTLGLMVRVEDRLNKFEKLACSHCGHEELLAESERSRDRLLRFIEREIEKLVQKAGLR